MEIEILLQHGISGEKPVIIPASMPFEMYGFKFAAHKAAYTDNGHLKFINKWKVSNIETGRVVVYGADKRKEAVEMAKKKLKEVGRRELKRVINECLN
jgi:hypothetical protein